MRQALGCRRTRSCSNSKNQLSVQDTDEYVYIEEKNLWTAGKLIRRYRKDPDDNNPIAWYVGSKFHKWERDLISDDCICQCQGIFRKKWLPVEWSQEIGLLSIQTERVRKASWDEVYQFHYGKARVKAVDGYNFVDKNLYSIFSCGLMMRQILNIRWLTEQVFMWQKSKTDYFEEGQK